MGLYEIQDRDVTSAARLVVQIGRVYAPVWRREERLLVSRLVLRNLPTIAYIWAGSLCWVSIVRPSSQPPPAQEQGLPKNQTKEPNKSSKQKS